MAQSCCLGKTAEIIEKYVTKARKLLSMEIDTSYEDKMEKNAMLLK
jgi:hypothetical protein